MAELLIVAAGYALGGAAISGTVLGLSGATIGYIGGSLLASALVKPPNQSGPRLGDLRVQGTEYGAPIPWVAGGPRISGQIAWSSNRREIATTTKVGKGGSSKVTNYTYEVDLLILLTENQIEGVSRIWSNGELVYNGLAKSGVWNGLTIYTGAPDQLPDPTYEAAVGAGNAPAYRGRGYVVITGLQLGGGGQIPNLTFEVGLPLVFDYSSWTPADGDTFITELSNDNQRLFANTFFGNVRGGWVYKPTSYPKRRYVEFSIDPASAGFGWFVGARRLSTYALPVGWDGSPWNAPGAYGVTNAVTAFISPSYITDGVRTNNSSFNSSWAGSTLGIEINNDTGAVLIFRDGALLWSFSTAFSDFCPTIFHVSVGTTTLDGVIKRRPDQWARPSPGLLPFTDDPVSQGEPGFPTIGEALESLSLRSGYAAEDFDTSALATIARPVRGMALGQVSSTRGALETLQTGYFFDVSKSDKIRFAPRATTPVADIPFADLGTASDPSGSEDPLGLIVGNELEVPAQVSLSYHNTAGDYNVATEHSDRLLSGQETNQVVQLGLGLLPAEAKGIADGLLVDQIASLTRTTLRLPLKYAYLEPGDVFTVTNADGRQYRLRSQSKRDTLTILEHECVMDDAGALTSAQITSSNYALTETVRQIAPTIWEAMDIPLLRDADNSAGFYVALAPNRAAPVDQWDGGVFVRAWSADAFEQLLISGDACTMGATVGALGSFDSSGRFDERNTVTVRITGELANTTRLDMLDDLSLNAALIGSEIVRFRLATFLGTVDGENEYTLSGLLRGQRGTEQHMATHAAGERFVLLNSSLRRVANQTSEVGVASQVKAVTLNTVLSAVTAEAFTDTAVALTPFSVANLRCLPAGADLALSWQRRTRLSYRYGGTVGASVPLGEASEAYRIEVRAGAVLRNTHTATDSAFTYTAAQIAADGFTPGQPISFTVRQISEIVGPGFPATVQGNAP